jgi:putative transposase
MPVYSLTERPQLHFTLNQYNLKNAREGYRRLTFMMLDADIVAVSPTSIWRVYTVGHVVFAALAALEASSVSTRTKGTRTVNPRRARP